MHSLTLTVPSSFVQNSTSAATAGRGFAFITLALALTWLAVPPTTGALSPAPDGGYPGGNTAEGDNALYSLTSGAYNTATGFEALTAATSTSAADNTATGALALHATTSGFYNTATGVSALLLNTTGYYNVASGVSALTYNIVGHDNVAEGFQALLNDKGSFNIGVGSNAGANLTSG